MDERGALSKTSTVRLGAALLVALLMGGSGLAAADSLPDSAQHVAHRTLGHVGIDVPDPERYHGGECGADAKKNHGAYVRDDHTLAKTDCGKKVKAVDAGKSDSGESGSDEPKADKGPCSGKPSWAGDKTMTADEKTAAKAERAAQCGTDDDVETDPSTTTTT